MKKIKFYCALILLVLVFFSCASTGKTSTDTIIRSSGNVLGTVTATASISENRKTGKTTGDTLKYGYITNENEKSQVKRLAASSLTTATDTAYANALYDVIQQAKNMGGNALNEVIALNKKNYDIYTETETVTVTITAQVIKTK